jgi:hypothetical protein
MAVTSKSRPTMLVVSPQCVCPHKLLTTAVSEIEHAVLMSFVTKHKGGLAVKSG